QGAGFRAALVEHGLDGEGHAFLQLQAGACPAIVQDLGFLVENCTNTVPAVLAHDGEAVAFRMLLDHFADIAQAGARTHHFDALVEDRKSTRLNSSHVKISYAVFCLKKKTINRSINHVNFNSRIQHYFMTLAP